MKVYKTQDIRNVAILGHGGCGKTSLVEAMAHVTGVTNRQGRVEDGNTISDYDKEEIRRKFSISTSVVPIEWNFWKINLLDTPGYLDFAGEVDEALAAADGVIVRRHIVGGANRTLFSVDLPPRLCRTGT